MRRIYDSTLDFIESAFTDDDYRPLPVNDERPRCQCHLQSPQYGFFFNYRCDFCSAVDDLCAQLEEMNAAARQVQP